MAATSTAAPPGADLGARTRRRTTHTLTAWLFLAPFAVVFTVSFLGPIIASVWNSLFTVQRSATGLEPARRVFAGVDNYAEVLGSEVFWQGIGRVLLFGVFQIPLMIVGALVLALMIDSLSARFVALSRIVYFLPFAIPGVIAAIVWAYLYSPSLSPLSTALEAVGLDRGLFLEQNVLLLSMANITTWTFTGYNMLIFLSALKTVPSDLYEAARIDGASAWSIVWHIKVPLVRNALLLTVLLSIIGTIQLFSEPFVLRKVANVSADYTPMMMAYNAACGNNDFGAAGAISVVLAVIAGLLAFGYSRVQARFSR
ncbi:sugar ABC transporter permease [Nocardioides rotundus]|uniref:carbohydrate ABC transporter permease n=1 Tax=Nocardioides rotundus TaxID=1774216 RepID=UPI001CBE5336|nr:sugar ABC transporter permease [Nocardioides rotundus]